MFLVLFALSIGSLEAAPGQTLYPLRNALSSVGLAQQPVEVVDRVIRRAEVSLERAEELLDENQDFAGAEAMTRQTINHLSEATSLLKELSGEAREERAEEITDLNDDAYKLLEDIDEERADAAAEAREGSGGDDDNSGSGSEGDDNSGSGSGSSGSGSDDDNSGSGSDDDNSGSGSDDSRRARTTRGLGLAARGPARAQGLGLAARGPARAQGLGLAARGPARTTSPSTIRTSRTSLFFGKSFNIRRASGRTLPESGSRKMLGRGLSISCNLCQIVARPGRS